MMSASDRLVASPGRFVPSTAVSFGSNGDSAVSVDAAHPLPVADACYGASSVLLPDQSVPAGRALLIVCTTPGDVALRLTDASVLTVPVSAGLSILPFAVVQVVAAGSTAVASYRSLS